jgi:hypothetical protein
MNGFVSQLFSIKAPRWLRSSRFHPSNPELTAKLAGMALFRRGAATAKLAGMALFRRYFALQHRNPAWEPVPDRADLP